MNTVGSLLLSSLQYLTKINIPSFKVFNPFASKDSFEDAEEADPEADPPEEDPEADPKEPDDSNDKSSGIDATTPVGLAILITYYIAVVVMASFVANDLIFMPWPMRLLAFIFVILLSRTSLFYFTLILAYYVVYALYSAYLNFRDQPKVRFLLKPPHYAILPLMTARGWGMDFLNPFSYFQKGEDVADPKYVRFKKSEKDYKTNLNMLIPEYYALSQTSSFGFKDLLKKFNTFLYEINKSHIKIIQLPKPVEDLSDEKLERQAVENKIVGAIMKSTGAEKSQEYVTKELRPAVEGEIVAQEAADKIAKTSALEKAKESAVAPTQPEEEALPSANETLSALRGSKRMTDADKVGALTGAVMNKFKQKIGTPLATEMGIKTSPGSFDALKSRVQGSVTGAAKALTTPQPSVGKSGMSSSIPMSDVRALAEGASVAKKLGLLKQIR